LKLQIATSKKNHGHAAPHKSNFSPKMPTPNLTSIRQQLERTVGPAPWYWKTFQAFIPIPGSILFGRITVTKDPLDTWFH
jgi:hypothetical protein